MTPIDRQRARNCLILVTTVCLAALFTTGCDECQPGATMCQGEQVLGICGRSNEDAKATWRNVPCPIVCREVATEARCVDSREPVAECAMVVESGTVCLNGQRAFCWQGYPFGLEDCPPDTRCQMTACGGRCVIGDAPDSRCWADAASFCDGNSRAVCECGFEKSRAPCETLMCQEKTMTVSTPMGAATLYSAGCFDR